MSLRPINAAAGHSLSRRPVLRVESHSATQFNDAIAIEAPLEIRVYYARRSKRLYRPLVTTMRTPGNDRELALGYLFSEGIIDRRDDIRIVHTCQRGDLVRVHLADHVVFDPRIRRRALSNSSCGVCGTSSHENLPTGRCIPTENEIIVDLQTLFTLPEKLRASQVAFQQSGGLHAAALVSGDGSLQAVREDVGRHNALDKLIGSQLVAGQLPSSSSVLLMSSRASFELVQKASRAGIPILATIGAPTTFAIDLASQLNITLLGFLRQDRVNIYTHPNRIQLEK